MARRLFRFRYAAAVVSSALLALGCDREPPKPAGPQVSAAELQHRREMAAALFSRPEKSKAEARAALAPLVERGDAAAEDLVRAAVVELAFLTPDLAKAKALLERAYKLEPKNAALNYNLGRIAKSETDFVAAAKYFRAAVENAPNDAPSKLQLAGVLEALDDQASLAEEQRVLREVIAAGVDQNGPWYRSAAYMLAMALRRDDAGKGESDRLLAETNALEARGIKVASGTDYDMGYLGRLGAPPPAGNQPGAGHMPTFGAAESILPQFAGASHLFASDLDGDGRLDLVAYGSHGIAVGLQRDGFKWEAQTLDGGPVDLAIAFDLGNDEDMDLLFARNGELHLLEAVMTPRQSTPTPPEPAAISWKPWTGKLDSLPSAPSDMLAVDYDHEGDLDLLFVGAFGVRLLRDDGARVPDKGGYTDVTSEAQLPKDKPFKWCVSEDFDTDQDVDLMFAGHGDYLASNLRGGKFVEESAWLGDMMPLARPVVADVDGDGRPDILSTTEAALWLGQPSGKLRKRPELTADTKFALDLKLFVLDLDLNGALDAVAVRQGKLAGCLDVGLPTERALAATIAAPATLALIDDLDGDLAWDVVALGPNGVDLQRGTQKDSHAIRLALRGDKNNMRGVGAVVEVRAGGVYRRIYWRGEPQLIGAGDASSIDYLRVTWPNGIVQYDVRTALGDRAREANKKHTIGLLEDPGLPGSCPFLYTWNGSKFVFVTDVLGITPLGLPMEPGMLVPPDHDEYVLVRGDQLKPKDGMLEMQFTEELREVTYLDRIRLDVVDSLDGVEIYPNELFCFPPFPEPHTHTVRAPLAPVKATGSDGKDWTTALTKIDDDYAAPFTPIDNQFIGLANPHWLELEFDPARVKSATKLRLVMTGWFFWTDASVNMASARDAEHKFVPPILQLPDESGGWKDAGPPIGFPAGKTKSMVIDVTQLLDREHPKLRLFSTLRLYWDSIRLAVDADDAALDVKSLEASSAMLWRRGFSAPEDPLKPNQPERFEWERLAEFPRWNQHPGLYTKYGETLPLLSKVDDQFAILGSGDALTVKFDARSLPPPRAGFHRDYLVYLDGWAKDRDPNTVEALNVEPLPFHAMSGYPYRADEHFPDDADHRKWQREWNTRPAYRWIDEFVPQH